MLSILRRYLFLLLLWLPAVLFAQVKFSTVPGSLQLHQNEVLQVTYVIENAKSIEQFKPPAFRDFKILQGPIQSEGTTISNGEYSQYSGITYVLQPLKKGNLVLAGAVATINGQKMQSNKVVIEVGDKVAKTPNPYPRNPGAGMYRDTPEEEYVLKPEENAADKIKNNLKVVLELDKKTAYVGEPIVSTYKLYTRLRSESRVTQRPSLNGFSVYDMVEPDRLSPQVETIDGNKFMSHIIRKTQLIPLQEGDFVLEPTVLDNKIHFLRSDDAGKNRSDQSAFERMFEGFFDRPSGVPEEHQVSVGSEPQTVHIKPLPEGAPESFNGAVGKFTISARLLDSSTKAGEPVLYDLQVDGAGNLPLVTAPEWQLPAGVHMMDPNVTDTIDKSVAPMTGRKTFHYSIIPDVAGRILLPAIEFSYFDPSTANYKTLHTDSIPLLVEANIRPKNIPRISSIEPRNHKTWLISLVACIPIALGLLLLLVKKRSAKKVPAPIVENPVEEPMLKPDPLAAAKTALQNNDATAYFHGIQMGLWSEITTVLALPGSAQQQPQVLLELAARGLDDDALRDLKEIWQTCDWILYLPAASHQLQPELLPRAEALIYKISKL
ncbi:MAG TPA: BatD family protein [Flavihumibacter sp.]|nr:BatD family protein [Flavihumibacter sp.]